MRGGGGRERREAAALVRRGPVEVALPRGLYSRQFHTPTATSRGRGAPAPRGRPRVGGGLTETQEVAAVASVTMRELLEAGVHFGHQTRRWDPKMRPYIFSERNGIHIIDLRQTLEAGEGRSDFVKNLTAAGG